MRAQSCSSLREEHGHSGTCRDGFPQTGPCFGFGVEHLVPVCCNEELSAHLYGHSGGQPPAHMVALGRADEKGPAVSARKGGGK